MKTLKLGIIILAVITFACADKNEKEQEEELMEEAAEIEDEIFEEDGISWITLFDGETTDQWRGYNSDAVPDNWTIEDGALKFTPGEEGGKNIISKDKFENFVLSLDWKISEGGNSGIFWSVFENEKFKEAYETGPEIQVLDNDRHPDSKVAGGTHKAGSLYDLIAYPPEAINPAGEWNHVELSINHNTNQGSVSMNGNDPITFSVHGPEWDKMVENSKFKGWEGFGKYSEGHIGLQDHSDVVWFKDIKIKRL